MKRTYWLGLLIAVALIAMLCVWVIANEASHAGADIRATHEAVNASVERTLTAHAAP